MSGIALIGYMASGKTVVAQRLAQTFDVPVYDTDKVFRQLFGHSAGDWIRLHGEPSFRQYELQALQSLVETARQGWIVLATGGGLVTWGPSQALLKEHFDIVWLRARPDTVVARVVQDETDRPLLQTKTADSPLMERVTDMLRVRSPIYEDTANWVVDVDDCAVDEIVTGICSRFGPPDGHGNKHE